ncbi:helix-turn-helix domain-containing protein [Cohnella hashimotonis]|uniref:Helix-turn-helix domain-containing protein n=1 Tax=Cohnella hashimotonis TaxID=2826895 RepID=A0ABT6TRD3_9BACL|nr:helix-turn-helix domain-containing protein [Cohnella hashimotonis]MDI4649096.1 helix-turn-helix domain-containing protein [Cohnella hashimotonis]
MYMFDVIEKEMAIAQAVALSENMKPYLQLEDAEKTTLLVKALANYIERSSTKNTTDVLQSIEQLLTTGNTPQALQRALLYMVTLGVDSAPASFRTFTTGEAARFFGVSVATINNWINQGRFQGVEKGERFKQARIPENAVYTAPTGANSTVAEVAQRYESEQARLGRNKPMTAVEELADRLNTVVHFEEKYGGTWEETLAKKSDLTPSEARDAEQWVSLLKFIEKRGDW